MPKMPVRVSRRSARARAWPARVCGMASPAKRGRYCSSRAWATSASSPGGVVAAHDALQFRELQHHLGDQVALGQLGGAAGLVHVAVDAAGDEGGHGGVAVGLVAQRPQLLLEDHAGEAVEARGQRLLAVGLVEGGGIRQAWANHLLVTGDHLLGLVAVDVGDGDESRLELAVAIQQVEVLLVGLHRGDQAFGRYLEEALVEAAGQRHRPFHQAADLDQQVLVDHRLGLLYLGLGQHLLADALAALVAVGQHPGLLQRLEVVVGVGQLERLGGVVAVATGGAAGGQAQGAGLDDAIAVEHHQPVGGARELDPRGAPAHVLRHRQAGDRLLDDGGQQGGGGLALLLLAVAQPGALVGLQMDQLVDPDAAGAGEALGGLGRRAVLEGGGQRRAAALDLAVRLLVGKRLDTHGQAARRAVGGHLAVGDVGLGQAAGHALGQGIGEFVDRARRQFLDAQFDQKAIGCHLKRLLRQAVRGAGPRGPAGSRRPCAIRSRRGPRHGPWCARAGCSAGVRSPRWRDGRRAG